LSEKILVNKKRTSIDHVIVPIGVRFILFDPVANSGVSLYDIVNFALDHTVFL
jgi:hypothetical protein